MNDKMKLAIFGWVSTAALMILAFYLINMVLNPYDKGEYLMVTDGNQKVLSVSYVRNCEKEKRLLQSWLKENEAHAMCVKNLAGELERLKIEP